MGFKLNQFKQKNKDKKEIQETSSQIVLVIILLKYINKHIKNKVNFQYKKS